jgi:hypothetical protein
MKTNTFTVDANFEDSGSDNSKGTFNLTVAPSNEAVKVDKPAGAKTIIQLLNNLGLGDLTSDATGSASAQGNAKDAERKTDLNAMETQLEVYYTDNGSYPSLANLSNASWRKTNLQGEDENAFKDPDGAASTIAAKPQAKAYAYQPSPANCNGSSIPCTSYTLTATLSDGTTTQKQSLN